MSRYATWDDVTQRYPDAAKIANGKTDYEATFINPAENYIDAQFASKYVVPFCNTISYVPPFISDLAIDVAYYRSTGIRSKFAKQIKADIDERIALINTGLGRIMTGSGTIAPTNVSGIVVLTPNTPTIFDMQNPVFMDQPQDEGDGSMFTDSSSQGGPLNWPH